FFGLIHLCIILSRVPGKVFGLSCTNPGSVLVALRSSFHRQLHPEREYDESHWLLVTFLQNPDRSARILSANFCPHGCLPYACLCIPHIPSPVTAPHWASSSLTTLCALPP